MAALFHVIAMPKDTAITTPDGLLQPAWVEYLGQLEQLAGSLADTDVDDSITTATSWISNRTYLETSSTTTITAAIPQDGTIPQVSEGVEVMSVSITPTSAAARLRASSVVLCSSSRTADVAGAAALFIDGATDAAAVGATYLVGTTAAGNGSQIVLQYEWIAGTTSPITVAVRLGPSIVSAGNFTFNTSNSTAGTFSTVPKSSLLVEQITAG
jgi:hypothetical protein